MRADWCQKSKTLLSSGPNLPHRKKVDFSFRFGGVSRDRVCGCGCWYKLHVTGGTWYMTRDV